MRFPCITLILLAYFCQAGATKIDNPAVSGWVKEPDERGTFTILSSCLLTLTLCVYTAVHLNVRPKENGETQSWLEMSKWVVFGILAPELLVFIAWRQYASAMNLDRSVRNMKDATTSLTKVHQQTATINNVSASPLTINNISSPRFRDSPKMFKTQHTASKTPGLRAIHSMRTWGVSSSIFKKTATFQQMNSSQGSIRV